MMWGMLNMTSNQFVDALGGTSAVAALLGIRAASVSGWRDGRSVHAVPEDKLIRLAPVSEARGVASRRELFPADWHLIWPELNQPAKAEGA
ncbi:hypothetical protein HMPREF9702_05930 [Delftia acidovorans CCUG 15835]|jgi:DNA-binding transcriptional regulator YdaS (Cro superfamily)|nr:hypothetical protein HMPREF9702_05930 [Delftia acidovorans CCUG 15835]